MLILPAVDIKDGKCVRLTQGKPETMVVYEENPLKAAITWQTEGAEYLHIVDLDGAFSGKIINFKHIEKILSEIKIPAEVGGGIRTLDSIKKYIEAGASRVILGTKIISSIDFLEKAVKLYGNKIAVSIDASSGKIVIEGWGKQTDITAIDFTNKIKTIGIDTIIYTDISTDGTLKGPNFKGIQEFIKKTEMDIIASGGVSSIADIEQLSKINRIKGIIIGKALYTDKIKLKEALKYAGKKNNTMS